MGEYDVNRGGLPAHRYTHQVTERWPRGSEPASPPKAVLFDPPKPSCLTFGSFWFSHSGAGPVWAWGGVCKGEDKPECPCLPLVYHLLSLLLFFSLLYSV